MNVVINILRVITCTFAGLLCVKRKRAVVVFIVMRFRCDYKLFLMRMDRDISSISHRRNLTRHRYLKNPK